jgi:transcriptional regulator with XRE-family HTH domain
VGIDALLTQGCGSTSSVYPLYFGLVGIDKGGGVVLSRRESSIAPAREHKESATESEDFALKASVGRPAGKSTRKHHSIERGKENPTLDTLIKLARSLDVDLGELFTFVEFEDPAQRKQLLVSLANRVGDKHSKLALKILSAVVQEG